MENNFNLKKFLTENKLTSSSRITEEEQDTGYRIYNYSIGRGDFDVWIDNDIIDKDINDVLDTEDEDSYSTLDSRLSFAEFKVLGDEGGIVIIDNHGEGAQYDRDPYKWTQEQWDTIEQEVEKYW